MHPAVLVAVVLQPSTRVCVQDYQHIEQGCYSLPWDMVETRNRQWSPLHVARRSAQVGSLLVCFPAVCGSTSRSLYL